MEIGISRMKGALSRVEGIIRPDWGLIADWINENISLEQRDEAWREAQVQWLWRLRQCFGEEYSVTESASTILFSSRREPAGDDGLEGIEGLRNFVLDYLRGVARDNSTGKKMILAFRNEYDLRRYLAHYDPQGIWGNTRESVVFRSEPVHAVTKEGSFLTAWVRICLCHLDLPVWLEEALALRLYRIKSKRKMNGSLVLEHAAVKDEYDLTNTDIIDRSGDTTFNMAGAFHNTQGYLFGRDLVEFHRSWWREHDIGDFWSGRVFCGSKNEFVLGCSLADLILEVICAADPKYLADFISGALAYDGGDSAARKHLRLGLARFTEKILGRGNWGPQLRPGDRIWRLPGLDLKQA